MSDPTPFRTTSYRHRAYLAEAAGRAELEAEGRLLGWPDHPSLVAFHERFTPAWFAPGDVPRLRQGFGANVSQYRPHHHDLKVLAVDRHVLGYSHELAHAATSTGRGNGHHPRWAGAYVAILAAIDPHAAEVLRRELRRQRLTITNYAGEVGR